MMTSLSAAPLVFFGFLLIAQCGTASAQELPERRQDQYAGEFSYYIYPIAGEIPGMGRASGAGASVLNFAESTVDFTAFKLDGDFAVSGYTLLDLPLVKQRLIADAGTYDFNVVQSQYGRGIDSDADNSILPHVAGGYNLGQLTLTFDQRSYEGYVRVLDGQTRLLDVRDAAGQTFPTIDTSKRGTRQLTLGGIVDLTDDRLDPRTGIRLEAAAKMPTISDPLRSDYLVTDINLTGYIPMRERRDALVLNLFRSDAHVTREGETDYASLQEQRGLRCDKQPDVAGRERCHYIEDRYLGDFIAANRHGTATALGGTQRLRAFDNGRFYAGHALAWGVEYRWNLTDENTPFDILIAKGVRTGLQLAVFAEGGTVSDEVAQLFENHRHSYGAGFRIVLSGIVVRADYATGDEGDKFQLFIGYPWSMFSVDNPA